MLSLYELFLKTSVARHWQWLVNDCWLIIQTNKSLILRIIVNHNMRIFFFHKNKLNSRKPVVFFQFVPQRFSTFPLRHYQKIGRSEYYRQFHEGWELEIPTVGWRLIKFEQWMRLQFVGGITYIIKQLLFQILESIRWTCMSLYWGQLFYFNFY